ncbi:MAG: hypothetical protein AAGG02_08785 [Cyanobacteria bacterium P01_H01_bin.15]
MLTSGGLTGRNVMQANYADGRFQKTQPGGWQEFNAVGEATFSFQETARDDWSVYLIDPSRNLQIQIDIHRKMISWGQNNGPRSDLYPIVSMARAQ